MIDKGKEATSNVIMNDFILCFIGLSLRIGQ
jgi:hypothetical protein